MQNPIQKPLPLLTLVAITIITLVVESHAAVIVDPVDGISIQTSHLGSDSVAFVSESPFGGIGVDLTISGPGNQLLGGYRTIEGSSEYFFASPFSFPETSPAVSVNSFISPTNGFSFLAGAGPGLNYSILDLDGNGIFETVFEFDFGADPFSDPDSQPITIFKITRYAYNEDGSFLSLSEAAEAFNAIPEPSNFLLIFSGFLTLLKRNRVSLD